MVLNIAKLAGYRRIRQSAWRTVPVDETLTHIINLAGCAKRARGASAIDRFELHGTSPDPLDILKHFLRSLQVQSAPIDLVIVKKSKSSINFNFRGRYARCAKIELRRHN
jgi:hypothetical protein